jgi:cyclopropane-fatty-acyl-phospholipid synthase
MITTTPEWFCVSPKDKTYFSIDRTEVKMSQDLSSAPAVEARFHLPDSAPAAARVIFHLMQKIQHGALDVQLPDGSLMQFRAHEKTPGFSQVLKESHTPDRALIRLHNWNLCSTALRSGDIGFAESFIAGDWTTPDLPALLKFFIANRDAMEACFYGTWWGSLWYRIKHFFNKNTRKGSQKNIHAHYDLGNDFYRLWLDSSMNYSSAWFKGKTPADTDLSSAQNAKVHRALSECGVKAGDRILEIGCGWGGLAEIAARDFNANVTGVTLSHEQWAWAKQRLEQAGLKADLREQDYRDIKDEPFDAIVSIEMFEAVGREYWSQFFKTLHSKLKSGGRACIQTITIRDDLFERYARSTDFIQQYIFPGGLLPSVSAFHQAATKNGLKIINALEFGQDYAETLRRWRHAFLKADSTVRKQGFDHRFMRIWEFYLAYCEAAFEMKNTSVWQFTLSHA